MKVRDLYNPGVRVTRENQALADAARAMLEYHIGALIVVRDEEGGCKPIGILTDRDVVRGQLRLAADLHCLTVREVMSPDPLSLALDLGVGEAIEAMNARAVRRAPVVDDAGNLVGIITLDDLMPAVAQELGSLASLMGTQSRRERPY